LFFRAATLGKLYQDIQQLTTRRSYDGGIHMILRLVIAAAIALLFMPAAVVFSQEHPEHPKKTTERSKQGAEHPKQGAEAKQVSTADISTGIKTNIDAKGKKSPDGKFHATHEGQDLALAEALKASHGLRFSSCHFFRR